MSGLLLYRQYLNNVRESIINYDIPEISSKDIKGVLEVAKDIEDLAYLDKILTYAGSNGLFDEEKGFINKSVRLESKLKKFMNVDSIEDIIGLDTLYDVEESIIECCGELADINSSINYTNLSVDHLNFGNPEEIGANKFKTYQEEITKVFGILESCRTSIIKGVEDKSTSDIKGDITEESKENLEDIVTLDLPVVEENEIIEGIEEQEIEDIDAWVNQQDLELIEKYKNREIEEDYFNDVDVEITFPKGYSIEEIEEVDDEEEDMEEDMEEDLEVEEDLESEEGNLIEDKGLIEDIKVSLDNFKENAIRKEDKPYMKHEKLVNHDAVTEVDDVLAKIILKANEKLIKIPDSTVKVVTKFKNKSKNIYTNMVVDDDEED